MTIGKNLTALALTMILSLFVWIPPAGAEERTHPIRLTADGGREIHPYWQRESATPRPLEFDIPRDLTEDGVLELQWQKIPGVGGNGRGCVISEVWLMRKNP